MNIKQTPEAPLTVEECHPDTPFVNAWLRDFAALLQNANKEYDFDAARARHARKEKEPSDHERAMIRAAMPHLRAARQAEREGRRQDARPHLMAFADTLFDFKAQEGDAHNAQEGKP